MGQNSLSNHNLLRGFKDNSKRGTSQTSKSIYQLDCIHIKPHQTTTLAGDF